MHPKLVDIVKVAPLMQSSLHDDTHVIIADTEQVVESLPGKNINLGIPIGARVENFRGTVTELALRNGTKLTEERDAKQFGIPYVSTATPIFDGENIVGVIGLVSNNEKSELLKANYSNLSHILNEISNIIKESSDAQINSTNKIQALSDFSDSIVDKLQNSAKLIEGIQYLSDQSKLLGLNASIEAARAGELGRGFEVVAKEIQKLATNSNDSSRNIKTQLGSIENDIVNINGSIHEVVGLIQGIAARMEELNGSHDQLMSMSNDIAELLDPNR